MKWKFFCTLLPVVVCARIASGTVAFGPLNSDNAFDPGAIYDYEIPPQILPTFDNTNFVIANTFTVNYANYSANTEFYEPLNTLNYTNTGVMTANEGFKFDTQVGGGSQHKMAATFNDNGGTVLAGSISDTANTVFSQLGLIGAGEIVVAATNVYLNNGTLQTGIGGFIGLTGQHVDLDYSTVMIEPPVSANTLFTTPNYAGTGSTGLDTNLDWDPFFDLTSTAATSSFPNSFQLTNSVPYFDIQPDPNIANNFIIRMVFIQNGNPNTPYKVYFDTINSASLFGVNAAVHVEWDGSYLDPASGNPVNTYLYLSDDYKLASSTNEYVAGGLPGAFSFITSPTPLLSGQTPTAAGFVNNLFPSQAFTNRYSYMNGNLVDVTMSTNASTFNPSGAITNLTGRIQIVASNDLTMAQAYISGPNYVSITCTNQFNGSAGASISAPYVDLNLGVTNGAMTVSNLLLANIPQWNGPVIAWSSRFFYGPNGAGGTNDYRVLIISNSFTPTSSSWIRNLNLHATNSLIISDVLSIYNSLYSDAQSLTLATNLIGEGATSLDGELNWESGGSFGTPQFPNLVWFTNNGAMRCFNSASFGNNYSHFTWVTTNYTQVGTNLVAGPPVTNSLPAYWLGSFINNSLITNQSTTVAALNFTNSGAIISGSGSFNLQASSASFVNGINIAGADVTVTATNLLLVNQFINAGHALNLSGVAQITDGESNLVVNGLTNGNIWVVGTNAVGSADSGFNVLLNPFNGDLLGTTVTNLAPANKNIINTWAGVDRGYSLAGYSNNLAVGHLVLDAFTNSSNQKGTFTFNGTGAAGVTNAMYVDCLDLRDVAAVVDGSYNPTALKFNTNFVIYYAQAYLNGVSVAEKLNHTGLDSKGNVNHLRWMPNYVGYFSYTNLVYPNGTTNAVNAALAQAADISSGGIFVNTVMKNNQSLPTQIFVSSEINLGVSLTNNSARFLSWNIPLTATNYYVQYVTNLLNPAWQTLTNFNNATNLIPLATTNASFVDTNRLPARYYRVVVQPWLTFPHP